MSNNDIPLHKDVLSIIQDYAKPKLWLYCVYDFCVYNDPISDSKVIEANTYRDVCITIFNENFKTLYKCGLFDRNSIIACGGPMNNNCTRCTSNRICSEHTPFEEVIKNMSDDTKYNHVQSIINGERYHTTRRFIQIKELTW